MEKAEGQIELFPAKTLKELLTMWIKETDELKRLDLIRRVGEAASREMSQ